MSHTLSAQGRASSGTPLPSLHDEPAHCPRRRSAVRGAFPTVASGRQPRSRRCCCLAVPSTPHRLSPGTPPNSSWPSPHSEGWSSPPRPAPPQHPLAPQFGVGPEVSLISKEYLGASLLRLFHQDSVLRHKGFPFLRISLEQALLGALEGKSQPVQIVETTAPAQADAFEEPVNLSHAQRHPPFRSPRPICDFPDSTGGPYTSHLGFGLALQSRAVVC